MTQRVFIIILAIILAGLVGFGVWATQQEVQAEPVPQVSAKWWGSAHADASSEAFVHWNEDDPAEVPPTCAKCHSGHGFMDYVGQDGSTAFKVDAPGRINDVVSCTTCHNDASWSLDKVIMPSTKEVAGEGNNNICMTCHSGMGAGSGVDGRYAEAEPDTVLPDASMMGPHYFHAAATNLGSDGAGGYEYEGKAYVGSFKHVGSANTCLECHDAHSLHIQKPSTTDADMCSTCHTEVVNGWQDYKKISISKVDYDGDGTVESAYDEVEGMRMKLMQAISAYSKNQTGTMWGFYGDSYPYAFIDTNEDGTITEDEATFPNGFKSFTPRMLKAAFNFMFVTKEPGAYVHNAKYVLQLMCDSIEDLSAVSGVSTQGLTRP